MMTNLFSIFDPSLSLFSFSWVFAYLFIMLFPFNYWSSFSISSVGMFSSISLLVSEFSSVFSSIYKGVMGFVSSIFLLVLFYNFFALFPYVFSLTSHLLVTFPLSYGMWLCIITFILFNFLNSFLCHLIPEGTPLGLVSFMVLVEFLSNLIRPLALTFRLTANMMAGHLLMSLIGGFLVSMPFYALFLGSLFNLLLLFMEMGVSFIQAYVFSTLMSLYLSEGKP